MPTSEWRARCSAGVLHDPESESVVCLCGLDAKEWPEGLEARNGFEISHLPRIEWLAEWATRSGDSTVPTEGELEKVDGLGTDLTAHDTLGVGRNAGVTPDPHGVGTALDADAAIGVDDAGQVSENEIIHNSTLSSGGDVTTPFYRDDWLEVYGGDARDVLRGLPSESVDCVVTSPP
jgi:hypothetical protein